MLERPAATGKLCDSEDRFLVEAAKEYSRAAFALMESQNKQVGPNRPVFLLF